MKTRYAALSFVSFLMLLAGIGWAYMLYDESMVEDKDVLDYAYSIDGAYSLYAEVINENPLYPVGTSLSDMAGYFYSISPFADVTFTFSFGPTISDAQVELLTSSYMALQNLNDEGEPYWTKKIDLSSSSATLSGVSAHMDHLVIDSGQMKEMISDINEEVGGASGISLGYLTTEVKINGNISGSDIDLEREYAIPLYFRSDYFYVGEVEENSGETINFYTNVQVERKRAIEDLWLQLSIATAGIALLVFALWKGHDRGRLDYSEFKDWISEGTYPGGDWKKEVYIPSVRDLVDIAIDTGKRAIHDGEENIFFVIDIDVLYYFMEEDYEKVEEEE